MPKCLIIMQAEQELLSSLPMVVRNLQQLADVVVVN